MQAVLFDEATGKERKVRLHFEGGQVSWSEIDVGAEIAPNPVTVKLLSDGSLQIANGHRRIAAFQNSVRNL